MNMQSRGKGLRGWIFSLHPCFFSSEDHGKIWATHPFTHFSIRDTVKAPLEIWNFDINSRLV